MAVGGWGGRVSLGRGDRDFRALEQSVFTVVTHRGELHAREVCACTHTHAQA